MRGPSPEVCMGCLKPHRRVDDAETALALRVRLHEDLQELSGGGDPFWALAETWDYVYNLFYHLTRGKKVYGPHEAGQYCPAPIPPEHWTAYDLRVADRFVLEHTTRRTLD